MASASVTSPNQQAISSPTLRNNNKNKRAKNNKNNKNHEPPVDPTNPPESFYSRAKDYWSHVPPTVEGMLGGYSSLNVPDIQDSHAFLDEYGPLTQAYALDCGAGIGRVTKQLLIPRFTLVDMVELTQEFLDKVEEYVGAEDFAVIGERFCAGLQDFIPPVGRYDLIWIQWVTGHLSDSALVGFLQRCAKGLSPNNASVIVVKENINSNEEESAATFDEVDSSFTRSRPALLRIFEEAGLEVIGERLQTSFPKSIFPVRMFALRPKHTEITVSESNAETN